MKNFVKGSGLTGIETVRVVNLRRERGGCNVSGVTAERAWVPTGLPVEMPTAGTVPFASFVAEGDGQRVTLWLRGTLLCVSLGEASEVTSEGENEIKAITLLDGEPLGAVSVQPGVVRLMMKHRRAVYLTYDSSMNFAYHGEFPQVPPMRVYATGFTRLGVDVGPLKLTGGSVSGNSTLSAADESVLTSGVLGAYRLLSARAVAGGKALQPVMARCRLLDRKGNTLMATLPSLLSARDGFQCVGSLTAMSSDGLSTLGAAPLQGECYSIKVGVPDALPEPWATIADRLVVELTPQLHPVDFSAVAPHVAGRQPDGSDRVEFVVPGAARSVALGNADRHRRMVVEALECCGSLFREAAVFSRPFGGGMGVAGGSAEVMPLREASAKLAVGEIEKGMAAGPVALPPWKIDMTSYSVMAETPSGTCLANPLREPFSGKFPGELFTVGASDAYGADGEWTAYISAELTGKGMRGVATDGGTSGAPGAFSPLLLYPDPSATQLTVGVSLPDGSVRMESLPLTPLPSIGVAYHLRSDLSPFLPAVSDTPLRIPAEIIRGESQEGRVEIFGSTDLTLPDDTAVFSRSVAAVAEPSRSNSSWDFSRRKLLVFGGDGVSLLTIGSGGKIYSLSPVDMRMVASPAAVCAGSGSAGGAVYAIAGNDLVKVEARKVTTLMKDCLATEVGYDAAHGEIWLAGGSGGLRRVTADGEVVKVSIPGVGDSVSLIGFRGGFYVACGSLYDTSRENFPPEGVEVELLIRGEALGRVTRVVFPLSASSFDGRLTVEGDNGTATPSAFTTCRVTGAVNAPVVLRVVAPFRRYVEVGQQGRVSADARILPPEV